MPMKQGTPLRRPSTLLIAGVASRRNGLRFGHSRKCQGIAAQSKKERVGLQKA